MLLFYLSLVSSEEEREKVTYIYENYYKYMAYAARSIVENDNNVEDIVHNAMLKIIDNLDILDLSNDASTKNLCIIIARQKAVDYMRSKDNQTVPIDEVYSDRVRNYITPDELVISKDVIKTLIRIIDNMSDKYKDVCYLKYVNGFKERDIANILDLPPKTVNMRIFRGKQILRKALKEEGLNV